MLSKKFFIAWLAGAMAFGLLAIVMAQAPSKPATPTITVYQDPT
jgi:hypothetical protein